MTQQKQTPQFIFKCETCGLEQKTNDKQKTKERVGRHKSLGHTSYWKTRDRETLLKLVRGEV